MYMNTLASPTLPCCALTLIASRPDFPASLSSLATYCYHCLNTRVQIAIYICIDAGSCVAMYVVVINSYKVKQTGLEILITFIDFNCKPLLLHE